MKCRRAHLLGANYLIVVRQFGVFVTLDIAAPRCAAGVRGCRLSPLLFITSLPGSQSLITRALAHTLTRAHTQRHRLNGS